MPEESDGVEYEGLLEGGEQVENAVLEALARLLSESSLTGCLTVEIIDAVAEELAKMGFDMTSVENGIMAGMLIQLAVDVMDSLLPQKRHRVEERRARMAEKLAERLYGLESLESLESLDDQR